jgi:glutathione S-transferase
MEPARATIYTIAGSHACRTAMLMLEHKAISYRVVELPTGPHSLLVRLRGFPGSPTPLRMIDGRPSRMSATLDRLGTVPAIAIDGRRVQRNIEISGFLERLEPDPPLYPADPIRRAAVEEAQRWGDEPLQMAARRVVLCASADGLDALHERGARGRLGALLAHNDPMRLIASRLAARSTFRAGGARDEQLVAAVGPLLDRVDELIRDGVLGGASLNAADLTILPSLALLDYRLDLRGQLRGRPCYALLERVLPEPPG